VVSGECRIYCLLLGPQKERICRRALDGRSFRHPYSTTPYCETNVTVAELQFEYVTSAYPLFC